LLEKSGVAHRQQELFPSEPAPELEAKRPPPQPKTTAMGGSGGEMIKAASNVDPFGNNDVIHCGGSSLAGGAATTTTTNNDAAAAELLPSDEDAAMPSYSRRRPVDDEYYCRGNHHGSRTTRNYAAHQSEFDDLEDEFETLDDKELAVLDVDNIVVCQRPIDDDAPYHYEFGNRQGASNHDGRAPL
jgi:hypothetical protein